jgi:hypothetical protein
MAPYETRVIEKDVQERLSQVLGSCLPEDGMDLILIDGDEFCWTSDSVSYDGLLEGTPILKDMISRIDDGDEPALTRVGNVFLAGVHLWTPCRDYGYAILMLSCENHDSLLQNWSFVETVLNQMQCIAGLLEMQDDPMLP